MSLRDWQLCSGNCPAALPCSKEKSEQYRALWDGLPIPHAEPTPAIRRPPCVHLGAFTGERRLCAACKGKVQVNIMTCAVFGTCTVGKKIDGIACCAAPCPRYEKPAK